jgi:SPP1 gp7 family putative phage head morphogenesis protein
MMRHTAAKPEVLCNCVRTHLCLNTFQVNASRRRTRRHRLDPTNTTLIRKGWAREASRRFTWLKRRVWQVIVTEDGFGLGPIPKGIITNAGRFAFKSAPRKHTDFMQWLMSEEERGVLSTSLGTPIASSASSTWQNVYIDSAYKRGITHAVDQSNAAGGSTSERFIDAALSREIHADSVGIIYSRAYTDLKGITDAMDQQISRELAAGLVRGDGAQVIASAINKKVDNIGKYRAEMLARTETIYAYNEAQLNSFEELGINGVSVLAEWSTAGDDRVCPKCDALEGRIFTIREARGMLPLHPNCRCGWQMQVDAGDVELPPLPEGL